MSTFQYFIKKGQFNSSSVSEISFVIGLCVHIVTSGQTKKKNSGVTVKNGRRVFLQPMKGPDSRFSNIPTWTSEAGGRAGYAMLVIRKIILPVTFPSRRPSRQRPFGAFTSGLNPLSVSGQQHQRVAMYKVPCCFCFLISRSYREVTVKVKYDWLRRIRPCLKAS